VLHGYLLRSVFVGRTISRVTSKASQSGTNLDEMAADDATVGTTAWLDSAIGSLFKSDSSGSAPPSGTLVPPTTTESIADDSSLSSVFGAWAVTTENPAPISGSGNIEEGCGGSDFWQWASSAADGLSLEALRPSIGLGIDSFGNSGASAPALRSDTSRGDSAALNLSDEVATLSVKDLKSLIKRAGLSDQSCVERNDLEALAVVAQKRLLEAEALKQSTAASSAAAARRGTGASALAHDIADKHGKHPVRTPDLPSFRIQLWHHIYLARLLDNQARPVRYCIGINAPLGFVARLAP